MSSKKRAYILRTCRADMTSHCGFRWPNHGHVECPDWNPEPCCGGGLHGLLNGEGNGRLLSWCEDAKWIVFTADADSVVEIGRKVKVPAAFVVFCGTRLAATEFLASKIGDGFATVGRTATAGDSGTATAGDRGTATAGDRGTATAGYGGTATAGYWGTATAGDSGTATAGDGGTILIRRYDSAADRYRTVIGYVGEDGIKADTPYKLDEAGSFVEATP